jgi:hypothetical protein
MASESPPLNCFRICARNLVEMQIRNDLLEDVRNRKGSDSNDPRPRWQRPLRIWYWTMASDTTRNWIQRALVSFGIRFHEVREPAESVGSDAISLKCHFSTKCFSFYVFKYVLQFSSFTPVGWPLVAILRRSSSYTDVVVPFYHWFTGWKLDFDKILKGTGIQ